MEDEEDALSIQATEELTEKTWDYYMDPVDENFSARFSANIYFLDNDPPDRVIVRFRYPLQHV
jgi:hypothetical protein